MSATRIPASLAPQAVQGRLRGLASAIVRDRLGELQVEIITADPKQESEYLQALSEVLVAFSQALMFTHGNRKAEQLILSVLANTEEMGSREVIEELGSVLRKGLTHPAASRLADVAVKVTEGLTRGYLGPQLLEDLGSQGPEAKLAGWVFRAPEIRSHLETRCYESVGNALQRPQLTLSERLQAARNAVQPLAEAAPEVGGPFPTAVRLAEGIALAEQYLRSQNAALAEDDTLGTVETLRRAADEAANKLQQLASDLKKSGEPVESSRKAADLVSKLREKVEGESKSMRIQIKAGTGR